MVNEEQSPLLPVSHSFCLKSRRETVQHRLLHLVARTLLPAVRLSNLFFRQLSSSSPRRIHPPCQQAMYPMGDPALHTSKDQMDSLLAELEARKVPWVQTPVAQRANLARECIQLATQVMDDLVAEELRYKGAYELGPAESYHTFYAMVHFLADLARTFDHIADNHQRLPSQVRRHTNLRKKTEQMIVQVLPSSVNDHLTLTGWRGELWIDPGKEATQGKHFHCRMLKKEGELNLVLGAGNQVCVVGCDIAQKVLVDSCVVVCKVNPVNEYAGPFLERIFQPLVEAGALRFVYGGGADTGSFLCNHPKVESIHITGSDKTYDAIVWQGEPKVGKPPFKKEVSAEFGCVSPVIVVPGGSWTARDLDDKARDVVAGVTANTSCNCTAAKLLVLARDWEHRQAFLARVQHHLKESCKRAVYYPGALEKHAAFLGHYPQAQQLGVSALTDHPNCRPWLLQRDVSPRSDEYALNNEPWCGVLTEVVVECEDDAVEFMQQVPGILNKRVWGTLSCSLVCHPDVVQKHRDDFEALIGELEYGTVVVNGPGMLGYAFGYLAWGGFAAQSSPQNIQSGSGMVHNSFLIDNVEKTVLRIPWKSLPVTPFWLPSHRNPVNSGRRLVLFAAKSGPFNLMRFLFAALRG